MLLFITAEITTRSPATKKRGPCNRTSSGIDVRVVEEAMPNCAPALAARAVARHVVSASGYFTFTVAVPLASVMTSGTHSAVERKSLRTCTSICGASEVTVIASATA